MHRAADLERYGSHFCDRDVTLCQHVGLGLLSHRWRVPCVCNGRERATMFGACCPGCLPTELAWRRHEASYLTCASQRDCEPVIATLDEVYVNFGAETRVILTLVADGTAFLS